MSLWMSYTYVLSTESGEDNEEEEDDGFEGTPRPMLPYSSMYIFGPTNPYVFMIFWDRMIE